MSSTCMAGVAVIALYSLSACSMVGDYQRDEVELLLAQPYVSDQSGNNSNVATGSQLELIDQLELIEWWHQFDDPQINQLVDQALLHNYDLKLAVANVLESQALLDSTFAGVWPSVNLGYSPQRNFISTATHIRLL